MSLILSLYLALQVQRRRPGRDAAHGPVLLPGPELRARRVRGRVRNENPCARAMLIIGLLCGKKCVN